MGGAALKIKRQSLSLRLNCRKCRKENVKYVCNLCFPCVIIVRILIVVESSFAHKTKGVEKKNQKNTLQTSEPLSKKLFFLILLQFKIKIILLKNPLTEIWTYHVKVCR